MDGGPLEVTDNVNLFIFEVSESPMSTHSGC